MQLRNFFRTHSNIRNYSMSSKEKHNLTNSTLKASNLSKYTNISKTSRPIYLEAFI